MRRLAILLLLLFGCRSPETSTSPSGAQDSSTQTASKYRLRFRGNEAFSGGTLRKAIVDELRDFERSGHAKFAIDDAAFVVESLYRASGFPFATVSYEIRSGEEQRIEVRIRVEEGPRTEIGELTINGLSAISAEEAQSFFAWPRAGLLSTGDALFSRSAFSGGISQLLSHLRALGYRDAACEALDPVFDEARTKVQLAVQVTQGVEYRVQRVEVRGMELDNDVRAAVAAVQGRAFIRRRTRELGAALEEILTRRGYPDARASVEFEVAPDGSVAFVANVTPGPLVHVTSVEVESEGVTRKSFVLSRLLLKPGKRYDSRLERESFRRLFATGLFERVELRLEGEGTERAIVAGLTESDSLDLFIEPGLGSYEGPRVRAGLTERNLFGTGRALDLTTTLGALARSAELGVTDPWFLERELEGRVSIDYEDRQEPSFRVRRYSAGLGVGHKFRPHLEGRLGLELSTSELLDVEINAPDSGIEEDLDLTTLFTALTSDTRDQLFSPGGGGLIDGRIEWATSALGSEIDFVRLTSGASRFFRPRSGSVIGVILQAGIVFPQGSTDVLPLQERFFVGGERSVRAFKEDELGPRDSGGEPVGGEAFTRLSLEWRQKLYSNISGAIFGDAGTVALKASEFSNFADIEGGVGLGLRYMLPIGPLRIDGAWRLGHDDERDDFVLHISVGMPF